MHKDMTYDEYRHEVKEGILTEAGNCPVTPLLLMLQGKWKFQILYELFIQDPIRFGELNHACLFPSRIRKGRACIQNAIQRDTAPC